MHLAHVYIAFRMLWRRFFFHYQWEMGTVKNHSSVGSVEVSFSLVCFCLIVWCTYCTVLLTALLSNENTLIYFIYNLSHWDPSFQKGFGDRTPKQVKYPLAKMALTKLGGAHFVLLTVSRIDMVLIWRNWVFTDILPVKQMILERFSQK